jgi:hypothetical protein
MKDQQQSDSKEFVGNLKNGIWLFGLSSWVFGITTAALHLLPMATYLHWI